MVPPCVKSMGEASSTLCHHTIKLQRKGLAAGLGICVQKAGFSSQTLQSELVMGIEVPNCFQCHDSVLTSDGRGFTVKLQDVRHLKLVFLRVVMNTWRRWFIPIHWKGMQAEQRSQKRINLPHYQFC